MAPSASQASAPSSLPQNATPTAPGAQPSGTPADAPLPVGQPLREVERQLILKTLEMAGGNRLRAAEILGISPKTLYNKLGRYQARSDSDKTEPEPIDEA